MNKETGGPAFPTNLYNGMTLRDYFAAKAMQGLIASMKEGEEFSPRLGASYCYGVADSMLEARKQ